MFMTEQRHEQDAPGDGEVDGPGAGNASEGAIGEFLDLAALHSGPGGANVGHSCAWSAR